MIPECSLVQRIAGGRAFVGRPSIRARWIGMKFNGPLVHRPVGRANPCHTSKKKQTGASTRTTRNKTNRLTITRHNQQQDLCLCVCVCVLVVGVESSTTRERVFCVLVWWWSVVARSGTNNHFSCFSGVSFAPLLLGDHPPVVN